MKFSLASPKSSLWPERPGESADADLSQSLAVLRRKWGEVPGGELKRVESQALLRLTDDELVRTWEAARADCSEGAAYSVRGWYQVLYRDIFRGRKIMDVGSGLAFDTITYAQHGAEVTFVDIVETNLEVVKRLCRLKGLTRTSFVYLETLNSLAPLPADYFAIYCCGSLINAPLAVTRAEAQALLRHLPVGGRWVELAYPRERWVRDGRMRFEEWGRKTDGGAPWMEWHDLEKIRGFLAPAQFDVVLALDFHNHDFNWFDLIRRG